MTEDDMESGYKDQPEEKIKYKGSKMVSSEDGWITPAGVFYACTPEDHDEIANFLWQSKRDNVLHRLRENKNYEVLGNIDDLPPRVILKAAGYALLSHNLLAESNLPRTLSSKQLELIKRSNLTFIPESGRLDPSVYLEFRDLMKANLRIAKILESRECSYEARQSLKTFMENPSDIISVHDEDNFSDEIFDILSKGHTAEIKSKSRIDVITWRRIQLPSGNEAYIQFERHEHRGNPNYTLYQDVISLISKKGVTDFIHEVESKVDSRTIFEGDLGI